MSWTSKVPPALVSSVVCNLFDCKSSVFSVPPQAVSLGEKLSLFSSGLLLEFTFFLNSTRMTLETCFCQTQSFEIVKSLFDQLDRTQSKTSDLGERELREKQRHNQVMENIELQKSQTTTAFQAADAEMDYQLKLQAQYEKMTTDGHHSKEWIAQPFPQLICFFNPTEMTEEEKAKYAKKYNEWNKARNLPGIM